MSEPLSEERLKELRYIVTDTQQWYGALDLPTRGQAMNVADALLKIAPELLAELDRLRAENAAMRQALSYIADEHLHDWDAPNRQEWWYCTICSHHAQDYASKAQEAARALVEPPQ